MILRSGWSELIGQRDQFFGYYAGEAGRAMPGITPEAADWLGRARGVAGLGTECPSIGTAARVTPNAHDLECPAKFREKKI